MEANGNEFRPQWDDASVRSLATRLAYLPPDAAAKLLADAEVGEAARALTLLSPAVAVGILWELAPELRDQLIAAAPSNVGAQWRVDREHPAGSVGRSMTRPLAVFRPEMTVGEAIEQLRDLVRRAHIVYGFVTDDAGILRGVFAFRELLFASPEARLDSLMLRNPFFLRPEMSILEAARAVVAIHVPAYPVCDAEGRLVGMVRGQALFEAEAIEISAQAGAIVGVDREERLATRWTRSLKLRHPWLQLNLLTAFIAAGVVAFFQETVDRITVLAMFLPVLAGQSGNTGCQALAVTLRGMTLGDLDGVSPSQLVGKEALLGLFNGILVGIVAGSGMIFVAMSQNHPAAITLGFSVFLAMIGACVASGISGAMIPLTLKKLGADPATASSIFLTTATDVVSMGLLLGLATALVR